MNAKNKLLIGLAIFAVVLIGASVVYTALSGGYGTRNSGTTSQGLTKFEAPDFTIFDAQGNAVKLSDFAGRPVVLNFWASWCPPCKSEMPHFNNIYAKVKDDIVFMMVDLVDGRRETQALGQQYVTDQGFTFPVYFDIGQSAADTYGITSIPTTFFIDAQGKILTHYQGAIDEETLAAAIELIR